jgi:hypothetical protein
MTIARLSSDLLDMVFFRAYLRCSVCAVMIFAHKVVLLETLHPAGCLSLQVSDANYPAQGGVVGA